MKKKKFKLPPSLLIIALVAVLGVGALVNAYAGGSPKVVVEGDYIEAPVPEGQLGAAAGPFHTEHQYFQAGFQFGGRVLTTSTVGTAVTLAKEDLDKDTIQLDITPTEAAGVTITSPASSTLQDIIGRNTGDSRSYLFYNASSTGEVATAPEITLAAGTGVDILINSSSTLTGNVAGTSTALRATFVRKSTTDFLMIIEKLLDLTN